MSKSFHMYDLFRTISIEIEHLNQAEEKEEEECVICMGSINNENNESFTTHCNHVFHKDCLSRWCKQNNSCPSCRTINVLPCHTQCLPVDSSNSLIRESPFYHILDNEFWQGHDTTPLRSRPPYFNNNNNNIDNIDNINNIDNNNYTALINDNNI